MESSFGFLANSDDIDFFNTGCGVSVSIQQTERQITSIISYELIPASTCFNRCMHRRDDGGSMDRELDKEGRINSRHFLGTRFCDGGLGVMAIV